MNEARGTEARGRVKALAGGLLEFIYPSSIYCISCGNLIDRTRPYALCDRCVRAFRWAVEETCAKCGRPMQGGASPLCADCAEGSPSFEKGYACMEYRSGRRILHGFKYGGRAYYGEQIAQIMYDRIRDEMPRVDLILPVPMYRRKERKRGYNQADIAGRLLARKLELPYDGTLLLRARPTEAMSRIDPGERAANVKGAFALRAGGEDRIRGRSVMLVDDIFTTGSTVEACAEVLLSGGAVSVYFIVLAAGGGVGA